MQEVGRKKILRSSLLPRFQQSLSLAIGLLAIGLMLSFAVGIYASNSQHVLGDQKVLIQVDLDGTLSSMLDQETGLRGYVNTGNSTFLEPYNSGRPAYVSYITRLQQTTQESSYANTVPALNHVIQTASAWQDDYAQLQIKRMQQGDAATARSGPISDNGKSMFDAFRSSMDKLQTAVNRDLAIQQSNVDRLNLFFILLVALLAIISILFLWRRFQLFGESLHYQLQQLQIAASDLGEGNLEARVQDLPDAELKQLGETFNSMAEALQQQRKAMQDRDVLESVQHLNTILTQGLDLETLTREFLTQALSHLNLQLAALYLKNASSPSLSLYNTQGLLKEQVPVTFQFGEGLIGQVAQNQKALYLEAPEQQEQKMYPIKTIVGLALPQSTYHIPLLHGQELLGVLGVGSIYSMNEQARNVLDVVSTNLTAAISNTQAYRHIQDQAEELERRSREKERTNIELRHQRDELSTLNTALEEANQARSQFLSTMSHELRTPLTSIIGFSQILLRGGEANTLQKRQRNNIERVLKNGQHLLTMINDVLDLAKIEAGRMDMNYAEVDVKDLISAVIEQTQSLAIEHKLQLSFQVAEQVTTIRTDEIKLRQILLNLVSNGLKFTQEGGVTITAQLVTTSIVAGGESERIAISVQDTGIGISKEMQEHIFEAFYQVDSSNTRKYGGTGLGLSIVNQLTLLLGGKIELVSNPDMGSTFTIILPLRGKQMPAEIPSLRLYQTPLISGGGILSTSSRSGSTVVEPEKKRSDDERYLVLAIDDNPDVLNLINNVLENSPYKVVGIDDPSQAIEMVQRLNPDAITLDVMMPNVNGWQILSQLKSNPLTSRIPVIMLTVLEDRSTGYVLGADEYLVKPVEREELLNTLRRLATHRVSAKLALITAESPSTEKYSTTYASENVTDVQASIVLLIEDEPRIQAQLSRMLIDAGFRVRTANKQELTQTIEHTQPDMIALHLDLPKKSNSGTLLSSEGNPQEPSDTQASSEEQP